MHSTLVADRETLYAQLEAERLNLAVLEQARSAFRLCGPTPAVVRRFDSPEESKRWFRSEVLWKPAANGYREDMETLRRLDARIAATTMTIESLERQLYELRNEDVSL